MTVYFFEHIPTNACFTLAEMFQQECKDPKSRGLMESHINIHIYFGLLSWLRKRVVAFHSPLHNQDHSSGNIQNFIGVTKLRVFALLLKYCSQMAQAFVGVCPKVYKLAAAKQTNNKDQLSQTNVWHVL